MRVSQGLKEVNGEGIAGQPCPSSKTMAQEIWGSDPWFRFWEEPNWLLYVLETKRRTENKLKLKKVAKLNKITTIKMEKEKIIIKKKWTTKINLTKAPNKGLNRNKTVSKENHQRISSTKVSTRKKQRWCKNDKV